MSHQRCRRAVRSRALLFAALSLFAISVAADEATDKPREWKLSTAVGPAFALGKAGERWARLISDTSGGKLPVQLYPGAVLAQREPTLEFTALRVGAADLAVGSSLYWSPPVNALAMIGLPWLAPDAKGVEALIASPMRERLDAALEGAGVVPLAYAALPHRAIATTTREIRTPPDMLGIRVRITTTPFLMQFYTALGAQSQALAFADAQAAFRAGTLDAQEGTLATFAAARLDALGIRHVLLWDAIAEVAVFAANRAAWDGWSEAQRALVRAAARQAAGELPALAQAEHAAALAELQKRGITVTRLTESGRAAFAVVTRETYDRWARVAGEDLARAAEAAVKAPPP